MQVATRVFARPSEITAYWASERYDGIHKKFGTTEASLYRECPEHAKPYQSDASNLWFFEVSDALSGQFAGEFSPRFLPSRKNITALNGACLKASQALGADVEGRTIKGDPKILLGNVDVYAGIGKMDLSQNDYRKSLWHVLRQDWGLVLPEIHELGTKEIILESRPGLPCAAAMSGSVLPLLSVIFGDLRVVNQQVTDKGAKVVDSISYETVDGKIIKQDFDITALYGRQDLDWNYFDFGY